jgi:hypothetical protein
MAQIYAQRTLPDDKPADYQGKIETFEQSVLISGIMFMDYQDYLHLFTLLVRGVLRLSVQLLTMMGL